MQGTLTPNRALLENWRGAASSRGAARPDNRCQPHLGRASRGRHHRYTLLPSSPMGKFRNLSPGEVSAQKSALSSLPARPAQPSPQRRRTQDAPNPRTHVPGSERPFPGVAQNSARHAGTKWGGEGEWWWWGKLASSMRSVSWEPGGGSPRRTSLRRRRIPRGEEVEDSIRHVGCRRFAITSRALSLKKLKKSRAKFPQGARPSRLAREGAQEEPEAFFFHPPLRRGGVAMETQAAGELGWGLGRDGVGVGRGAARETARGVLGVGVGGRPRAQARGGGGIRGPAGGRAGGARTSRCPAVHVQ